MRLSTFSGAAVAAVLALSAPAGGASPAPPLSAPLAAPEIAAIVQALAGAGAQGLALPDAHPAAAQAQSPDPASRAAADARLRQAVIAYARAEHGRIDNPAALDPDFALKGRYDPAAEFDAAHRAGKLGPWLAGLVRADAGFVALVKAREAYAPIVQAGGWPVVSGRRAHAPGADPRLAVLRRRLAVEGYATPPAPKPGLRDPPLIEAVKAFQAAHGLPADGALNPATIKALNVPAAERLATIDANLERWRWAPAQPPPDRIDVDIAGSQAVLVKGGKPVLAMRAIAGRPDKPTPLFTAPVTAVVFNPPWVVPTDIARKEILPKARRSPGYMARNGYHWVGGKVVQSAGPKSSLGRIKFEINDPFDVYLHDTPARGLFADEDRWRSHGCVRLENPRDLAAAVLGVDRAAVDKAIDTMVTRSVPLKIPVPVILAYHTALVGDGGHVVFRPDVYGWDAKLTTALKG